MNEQPKRLIFASRPSALARYQTRWVMLALQEMYPNLACEEKIITTQGDKILDKPLPEIGGKGLFTLELEGELLAGEVHCAVHSLKDLPVDNSVGLVVGCVPRRADARDVIISAKGYTLESLPEGANVGTSSLRRSAQLLARRPDIHVTSLRGNVDTRVRKAMKEQYEAILLAGAGVRRLGLESYVSQWLPVETIMPAPGQGSLAVQCREEDKETRELLAGLEDQATRRAVTAERQFLLGLGGGCSAPVAAYAVTGDTSEVIHLRGRVLSLDGRRAYDLEAEGSDAEQLGLELARRALAEGAGEILAMVAEQ